MVCRFQQGLRAFPGFGESVAVELHRDPDTRRLRERRYSDGVGDDCLPFFLAWFAKRIVLRYGGIRAYRIGLPFLLGLIPGDYIVPTLWGIFGMMTGYQRYRAFPH